MNPFHGEEERVQYIVSLPCVIRIETFAFTPTTVAREKQKKKRENERLREIKKLNIRVGREKIEIKETKRDNKE